jgi:hypothetical protein
VFIGGPWEVEHLLGETNLALEVDHGPLEVSDIQAWNLVVLSVLADELHHVLPERLLADNAKLFLDFVSRLALVDELPKPGRVILGLESLLLAFILLLCHGKYLLVLGIYIYLKLFKITEGGLASGD